MVLIVLDSLTGQHTIVSVPLRRAVQQPMPATVIEHPRLARGR